MEGTGSAPLTRRRLWYFAAILTSASLLVWVVLPLFRGSLLLPEGRDYASFHYASRCLADGRSPYDPAELNREAGRTGYPVLVFPYLYPPLFAWLLQPLHRLSYPLSFRIFLAINLFSLLVTVCLLYRLVSINLAPGAGIILWGLLVTTFNPVINTLIHGQTNLLLAPLILLFALLAPGSAAGLPLAAALAVKWNLFPLLLYPLARKKWKLLAVTATTFLILNLLPLTTLSAAIYRDFFDRILTGLRAGNPMAHFFAPLSWANGSLTAWLGRPLQQLGLDSRIATVMAFACILGITLFLFRRMVRAPERHNRRVPIAALLGLSLLTQPVIWSHHLLLAGLALLMIVPNLRSGSARCGWALAYFLFALPLSPVDSALARLAARGGAGLLWWLLVTVSSPVLVIMTVAMTFRVGVEE